MVHILRSRCQLGRPGTRKIRADLCFRAGRTGTIYIWMPTKLDRCLSICQLALEPKSLHEVIYQVEMRAYAALGIAPPLSAVIRPAKAALEEGLGISPSEETEALYRELNWPASLGDNRETLQPVLQPGGEYHRTNQTSKEVLPMNNTFAQLSVFTNIPTDGSSGGRRTPTDGGGGGRRHSTDGSGGGR